MSEKLGSRRRDDGRLIGCHGVSLVLHSTDGHDRGAYIAFLRLIMGKHTGDGILRYVVTQHGKGEIPAACYCLGLNPSLLNHRPSAVLHWTEPSHAPSSPTTRNLSSRIPYHELPKDHSSPKHHHSPPLPAFPQTTQPFHLTKKIEPTTKNPR